MKPSWPGMIALAIVVAGTLGAIALGANEIAAAMAGVVAGSFSPAPVKEEEIP